MARFNPISVPQIPESFQARRLKLSEFDARYPQDFSSNVWLLPFGTALALVKWLFGAYSELELDRASDWTGELILWSIYLFEDKDMRLHLHQDWWSINEDQLTESGLHTRLFDEVYYPAEAAVHSLTKGVTFLEQSRKASEEPPKFACLVLIDGEKYMDFIDGHAVLMNINEVDSSVTPPMLRPLRLVDILDPEVRGDLKRGGCGPLVLLAILIVILSLA